MGVKVCDGYTDRRLRGLERFPIMMKGTKMRHNISLLLLVLLTAATAGGDDQADPDDADKVIGMSMMTLKNPYFKTLSDAAVAEAKKHGYRIIVLGAQADVEMQSRQVSDFIERKVSAIILSPCHSKNIGQAIRESNMAGIPVFTADIPCSAPDAKVVCHVATDNLLGGRQAAQAMIEALGMKGGKVAILDYKQAKACRLRTKGFFEEIGQHNARRKGGKIEIVSSENVR